jgi:hypothetical protein
MTEDVEVDRAAAIAVPTATDQAHMVGGDDTSRS